MERTGPGTAPAYIPGSYYAELKIHQIMDVERRHSVKIESLYGLFIYSAVLVRNPFILWRGKKLLKKSKLTVSKPHTLVSFDFEGEVSCIV